MMLSIKQLMAMVAALVLLASLARAQDAETPTEEAVAATPVADARVQQSSDRLNGRFRVGYRDVDVNGQEGKYRQHYNLQDGPRLFEAHFDYVATGSLADALDVVSFDLRNFGGDPFETLRFDVRKFGKYNFTYERLKSTYFYADITFPPGVVNPVLDAVGDFTGFDVDRVRDHAAFDLSLTDRASLDLDFNRYARRGDSTTQFDVTREIFQFDRPIDEVNDEFSIAFQYRWDIGGFVVQQQFRDFENAAEIFLPGANEGSDPDNATSLLFFFLNEPYRLDSAQTTLRGTLTPTRRLTMQVAASFDSLTFDGTANESSAGFGFNGSLYETDVSGAGEIERDTRWIDFDASYLATDWLSVVFGLWSNELDQKGDFTFGQALGLNSWDVATTGVELGVQYAGTEHVTLTGGFRSESRTVDYGQSQNQPPAIRTQETTHDGFFLAGSWTPLRALSVNGEYETGSYNDPFTLVSPTSRSRLRLQGMYKHELGVYGGLTYVRRRLTNDDRPPGQLSSDPNWNADRDQLNLRGGYRGYGVDASVGYASVQATNSVNQTIVVGQPTLFPILFESDASFFDTRFKWDVLPLLRFGGDLRFYDNEGSYALTRDDWRIYVEVTFDDYLVNIGYRSVDYAETMFGFNNYDASMLEASIGYVW